MGALFQEEGFHMPRPFAFPRFGKSLLLGGAMLLFIAFRGGHGVTTSAQVNSNIVKGHNITTFLSTGGLAAHAAMAVPGRLQPFAAPADGRDPDGAAITPAEFFGSNPGPDPAGGDVPSRTGDGEALRNAFVNDPCLDPLPPRIDRTVQSETEIAVLNYVKGANPEYDNGQNADGDDESEGPDGSGKLMVAGYNDSFGFYNANQGLSGFSYSTNGGKSWIDGGGLPPIVKSGQSVFAPGQDAYFGDPVVQVHHRSKTFYYASIYKLPNQTFALAVNRGQFRVAPAQGVESKANTRCESHPSQFGVPDPPAPIRKRIIWEPPVVASFPIFPGDLLDKEWLYVDQRTGELYLVYVRFLGDDSGATPLELVRSMDDGRTWTAPTTIVPNLIDTFNSGLSVVTTTTGRVLVSWNARTFSLSPPFDEISDRIESSFSDDDGVTFSAIALVTGVNPQGEPKGYNRGREQILDYTYLAVDKGKDDGTSPDRGDEENEDRDSRQRSGYGNVYVTYFDGKGSLATITKAGDIKLSLSTNNGASWHKPVTVNDDHTTTSHVFPSVQVNKRGTVFVTWIDRRVDPQNNILNDTWGAFSSNGGHGFAPNFRITDVSTDWFVRADARPNLGDYNSSDVINFDTFASIWADGRFPAGTFIPPTCSPTPSTGQTCPPRRAATPDSLFANVGNGEDHASGSSDRR
jgi:hypothetical protein